VFTFRADSCASIALRVFVSLPRERWRSDKTDAEGLGRTYRLRAEDVSRHVAQRALDPFHFGRAPGVDAWPRGCGIEVYPCVSGHDRARPPSTGRPPTRGLPAVQNVGAVYVSYYPDLAAPGAVEAIRSFTDLAVTNGVSRLVLLSGRGEPEAQRCEQLVRDTGIDWTLVRASWFNQNFSENYLLAGPRRRSGPAGGERRPACGTEVSPGPRASPSLLPHLERPP
jgi:hypothetical protein